MQATRSSPAYAGNDEAANKFKAETGIEVMKWDVGSYEACEAALNKIAE
jgi:acetoacetyl-CoA reductase